MVPAATTGAEDIAGSSDEPRAGGSRVSRLLRRMKWVLYGVTVIIYFFPPLDMASSVLPLHFRDIQWRYQATTFLGQSMLTQTMALTAATLLALLARHRRGAAVISLLCMAEAIVLVPVVAIFVADYLQIRPAIPEDLRSRFRFVLLKTTLELVLGGGLMAWLAVHLRGATGRDLLRSDRKPASSEHGYAVPQQG